MGLRLVVIVDNNPRQSPIVVECLKSLWKARRHMAPAVSAVYDHRRMENGTAGDGSPYLSVAAS